MTATANRLDRTAIVAEPTQTIASKAIPLRAGDCDSAFVLRPIASSIGNDRLVANGGINRQPVRTKTCGVGLQPVFSSAGALHNTAEVVF